MTAHPKYYSFVGLVAPADRKAVYMGYAFLYGVFGSLLGSNLGALPLRANAGPGGGDRGRGRPDDPVLDPVRGARRGGRGGLILFARSFGRGHPRHPAAGAAVMFGSSG